MDPHMNEDVFTWYLKKLLLKMKQFFIHVGDPPNKPTIRDKTKPLSIQMVGHENKQVGVTRLKYLRVSFGTRKCYSQYVLLHPEK